MIFDKVELTEKTEEGRKVKFSSNHTASNLSDDIETSTLSNKVDKTKGKASNLRGNKRVSGDLFVEDISFGQTFRKSSRSGIVGHEALRASLANGEDAILDEIAIVTRDFALVLGMERTLFAALNNSWLIAVAGIALMSVGKDDRAIRGGIGIIILSIISVLIAMYMHCVRIWQIRNDKALHFYSTIGWSIGVGILSLIALVLELYFGILYPYHTRTSTNGM
jgi:hypothetical protein